MKAIEIYAVEPSGARGRLNEFRGDNAALRAMGVNHPGYVNARAKLVAHATRCVGAWQRVLPRDKIELVQ